MSIAIGEYEPNIDTGLILPVVRKDNDSKEFINMELVPSHYKVDCGSETDEMKKWIEDGWLLKNETYVKVEEEQEPPQPPQDEENHSEHSEGEEN